MYVYIYTQLHTIICDIIICRYFWITKLSFPQEGHRMWTALSKSTRSNYSKGHKSNNLTCKFFEIEKMLFIKQQPHEMNNDACKLHAVEWLKQACIAHPFQLHYTITRRVTVSRKLTSRKRWLTLVFVSSSKECRAFATKPPPGSDFQFAFRALQLHSSNKNNMKHKQNHTKDGF